MELLNEIGKRAKVAKYDVQKYTTQMKNETLNNNRRKQLQKKSALSRTLLRGV